MRASIGPGVVHSFDKSDTRLLGPESQPTCQVEYSKIVIPQMVPTPLPLWNVFYS